MREIKFKTINGAQLQFTGLFDKNRVEIFEGDILRLKIPAGTFVYSVEWDDDGCWSARWPFKELFFMGEFSPSPFDGDSYCEVIGNIYETKVMTPIVNIQLAQNSGLGTWRDGYKEAWALAVAQKSWESLRDWARRESRAVVAPLRYAISTDLAGGRHSYIDTRFAGRKDAGIVILAEMLFIEQHNQGDEERFFQIMTKWLKNQDVETHIPPGHF